ncbi:ZIP family metal transporter [Candidatus Woesearchaeota archaeon]|nr:ZIP family metal transporter [Candidatus Woesearchaeota archaeon]
MIQITIYILLSVIVVSLMSLLGILSLFSKHQRLDKYLLLLVSLSAGTLFGGAFLHLLPETVDENGFTLTTSIFLLLGILVFFVLEKLIHWRHCHFHPEHNHPDLSGHTHTKVKPKHIATLNLAGDALHNFVDGLVIAASYLVNVPLGIATTVAVIFHEIPQEIADFGVLLYAGLSKGKALLLNFLSASVAIIGAIVGIIWSTKTAHFIQFILPFTAGGFVYIAGSNLIPELHKDCGLRNSLWHFLAIVLGIVIMILIK